MLLSAAILAMLLMAPQTSAIERGRASFRARAFDVAARQFRRALAADPSSIEARLYLARTLIELGNVREALQHVEALAKSADPEARFQAGRILQQLANQRYAGLRRVAPRSPEVDELAGRRLELEGRLAEALVQYRSAAAKDPARNGIHFLIGNVLWRQRELPAAESELRLELQRNPFHDLASLRLGQVLLASDRAGEAVPVLERAAEGMPESTEAHRELGKAYRKAGRVEDALKQWIVLEKRSPGDDQVHFLLGTAYREIGREQEALREFRLHREILAKRRPTAEKKP
jgi:tetratricopeptide (TPR) repeat protein